MARPARFERATFGSGGLEPIETAAESVAVSPVANDSETPETPGNETGGQNAQPKLPGPTEAGDSREIDLARAIRLASEAGQWSAVEILARELAALREGRS